MLAVVGLTFFAPLLGLFAIKFGPAEYVVLMIFAFATLASMVGAEPVKTIIGCLIGLLLTTIGLDPTSGAYRFTFDQPELHDGIEFIIIVIGLFSISEDPAHARAQDDRDAQADPDRKGLSELDGYKGLLVANDPQHRLGLHHRRASGHRRIRGKRRRLHDREAPLEQGTFGKGDMRGLAAPEAANNAAATVPLCRC